MELPVCRWRREEVAPGRYACHSPKLLVGAEGVSAELCAGCYCRDHEPVRSPGRGLCCRHRGEVVREQECPTCTGSVRLKVFGCALHGECTLARPAAGVACCASCPDYDPGGKPAAAPPGPAAAGLSA